MTDENEKNNSENIDDESLNYEDLLDDLSGGEETKKDDTEESDEDQVLSELLDGIDAQDEI